MYAKCPIVLRSLVLVVVVLGASGCGGTSSMPTPAPPIATRTASRPATEAPTAPGPGFAINPLTGLPAADQGLLRTPAVLISISHFPAWGRPQAGLSFAPFVFEISITEGASRFLAVFHGEFPEPEVPLTGGCVVRQGAFSATDRILGGRLWLDADADGVQGPHERGVGGVCVNALDGAGAVIGGTSSDSNGYFGFDLPPGGYQIEFVRPDWAHFSGTGSGGESTDSDADPATGRAPADLSAGDLFVDAGLVPFDESVLVPNPDALPPAQVGPIRSGRLVYRYLADSFANSCLIYAGASSEVLARLPQCHMVFHQYAGGGYMMDLSEMWEVARQNRRRQGRDFDYSGYGFSGAPPSGGRAALRLDVFYAYLNQSGWTYDPLYGAYLRSVDTSETDLAGVLFPDRDRLTGRQLHFENVIVVFARHDVVSSTNLDIRLDPGRGGDALALRDGQAYEIGWLMPDSGPLQFLSDDGRPFPLKPGHTWVIVMTDESELIEGAGGAWRTVYVPPEGEAR